MRVAGTANLAGEAEIDAVLAAYGAQPVLHRGGLVGPEALLEAFQERHALFRSRGVQVEGQPGDCEDVIFAARVHLAIELYGFVELLLANVALRRRAGQLGCSTSVVGFDGTSVGEETDFLTQGQTVSETIWMVKTVILGM